MHAAALGDFTAASTIFKQQPATGRKPVPSYIRLLVGLCRFDAAALKQVPNPRDMQLAALLRLFAAELSDTPGLIQQVATEERGNASDCFRICDGFTVKYGHDEPDESFPPPPNGHQSFFRDLYAQLKEIDGLPQSVAVLADKYSEHAIPEPELRGQVIRALLTVPNSVSGTAPADRGELPWSLMGQMIEEATFVQAWRMLRPDLAQSDDERCAKILPALPTHRYRGFIEMAQHDPTAHRQGYTNLLQAKDLESLSLREYPIIRFLVGLNWMEEGRIVRQVLNRADHMPVDCAVRAKFFEYGPASQAKLLANVSPSAPLVRTHLINANWPEVQQFAVEWEQASATQPKVLKALGKKYLEAGKFGDAERLLKAALAIDNESATLADLAEVYRRQGDPTRQIEVLKQQLTAANQENREATLAAITAAYMELGQWQSALKFAEEAAELRGVTGLLAAAEVYEVLQDWIKSEERIKAAAMLNAQRPFTPEFLEWYSWSQRNGQQGDATAAHQMALQCVQFRVPYQKDAGRQGKQLLTEATFYSCAHDLPQAMRAFEEEFTASADPFHGLHSALLHDRQGNHAARDTRLAQIVKERPKWLKAHADHPRPLLYGLVELLTADLAAGGKAEFDAAAIEKLVAAGSEAEQLDFYYFLGEYQNVHNQLEKSIDSWRECMVRLPIRAANRTLAGRALWSVGVTPQTYREALQARAGAKKRKPGT